MKVSVDHGRCLSTGLCLLGGGGLFRPGPGGRKSQPVSSRVPPELEALCLRLARQCPTGAILVER